MRVLAAAGVVLGLLIVVATALLVRDMHRRAVGENERELASLSTILADQADRALQAIELVQQSVIDELRTVEIDDEAEYVSRVSSRAVHDALRSRIAGLPQVNAVTLIDARGRLLNFSRYWPIPEVDISDRDYFRAMVADPELERYVSRPVPNRGDGTWVLYVARKVRGADGRFLGLVLGAVELLYFERLYARMAPAADYVLSLFRADGMLLVRHPPRPEAVGESFGTAGAQIVGRAGATRGVLRNVSPIDGLDRLVSSETLSHFPIRFSVSRTVEASLAGWRQQAAILGTAAALLVAGLAGLILLGLRQARDGERLARAREARGTAEERARGEARLRREYARFGVAMDNMTQGLCMFDAAGRLVVANRRMGAIVGDRAGAGVGAGVTLGLLLRRLRAARPLRTGDARRALAGLRRQVGAGVSSHSTWTLRDGRVLSAHVRPMEGPVEDGGWLLTLEDVTAQHRAEARIAFLAHHDALTQLPNRTLFGERLERAVGLARRGTPCAVLCLDLDRFKEVNDTHGHPAGDLLLREVAARLRRVTREVDTVARLGGDEFAVILAGAGDARVAGRFAARLIEELGQPYELEGATVTVAAGVGIALAPEDGGDGDALLRHADVALYNAKAAGEGSYRFFEAEMNRALLERRRTEAELRQALSRGELELHYQPLVRLASRRVVGFEALLRWRHPERGLVGPGEFIPLAEESGLIVPIGEWVLRAACAEAARWEGGLTVAVNLSPLQVRHPRLVEAVSEALEGAGLAPSRLELEITETVLLQDTDDVLETLRRLRGLGVSIALDDFGTGYSSLSYLRRFPFDKVKIDRCFVRDLGPDPEARAIVRAITGLCSELGMTTLAEGVEQEEHLAILAAERCLDVQGYLFSPPRPAGEIPALLGRISGGGAEAFGAAAD